MDRAALRPALLRGLEGRRGSWAQTPEIGFHAAYSIRDGEATETGAGNALLGAYLNRIGLPDRAVIYITQAAPNEITWLSLSDAKLVGIDVSLSQLPAAPMPADARSKNAAGSTKTAGLELDGQPLCREPPDGWLLKPEQQASFSATEKTAAEKVRRAGLLSEPNTAAIGSCTFPLGFYKGANGTKVLITSEAPPGALCHGCPAELSAHFFESRPDGDELLGSSWRFGAFGGWGSPGKITSVDLGSGRAGIVIEDGGTN